MTEIKTTHIVHMLRQAIDLARDASSGNLSDPHALITLERAANLAAHAAAELTDEYLCARDGWES